MRVRASKRAALGIAHGGGSATAQPFSPGWTFRSDALWFYAIPPCRVVDTRPAEALGANSSRRVRVDGIARYPRTVFGYFK